MYRCELWNLSCSYVNKYIVAWRKIKRRLWRLPYTTHNNIVHNLCNDVALRIVSFIHNNYNLYFVHNTISTPYFHRQRNSTNKLHRTKKNLNKLWLQTNYSNKYHNIIHNTYLVHNISIIPLTWLSSTNWVSPLSRASHNSLIASARQHHHN